MGKYLKSVWVSTFRLNQVNNMDAKVAAAAEKFVDNLLTEQARDQPSDTVKPEEILIELPEWFNEEQFNKGRKFHWANCYALANATMYGLVAVFAVPSILKVLMGSRRSNSVYTAYKRYMSTFLHISSWWENELKPGSTSWKSLTTVRARHIQATKASKAKGIGMVSQRDLAITQLGLFGYAMLKPQELGVSQSEEGQWEAYNHVWRVIGYFLGLEDRYNICRETVEETREVCRILMERVFTPCLNDVPEYFEHMTRVMLNGMWTVNPMIDVDAQIYWVKYLSNVPGYIYKENDRIQLQRQIKQHLAGRSLDEGVEASELLKPVGVEGLPGRKRMLYYTDYECLETVPTYKLLDSMSRNFLGFINTVATFYTWYLGRLYFNFIYLYSLYSMKYLPSMAMLKFGIKEAYVNMFNEDPIDDTAPKTNDEYYEYNEKKQPRRWYKLFL